MINIALQDDADATRTFLATTQDAAHATWRTAASGIPVSGQSRLTANWEEMKNGTYRASIKLEVPFMETASGSNSAGYDAAAAVAYTVVAIFTIFAPARSTATDRAHALRMLAHAVCGANATADQGHSPMTAAAQAFSGVSSTTPMPNLLVNLIPVN